MASIKTTYGMTTCNLHENALRGVLSTYLCHDFPAIRPRECGNALLVASDGIEIPLIY